MTATTGPQATKRRKAPPTGTQQPGHGRALKTRAWPRCPRAAGLAQTNFARNFPRSLFETTQKRCNSNDVNSRIELLAGELRATLLIDSHDEGAGGHRFHHVACYRWGRPHRRRENASATDASLDDACDQPRPTRFVHPSSWLPPTSIPIFPAPASRKVATKPTCFVL